MKNTAFLFLIAIFSIVTSCKTQDFTRFSPKLVSDYSLNEEDLTKIQYYTSGEIILHKEDIDIHDSLKIRDGEILTKKEDITEKIVIPVNTPCTFEKFYDYGYNILVISFDLGNNKTLIFSKNLPCDCFSLSSVPGWDSNNIGTVSYEGKSYTTNNGNVFLNVKYKSIKKITNRSKVLKGRKIN